MEKWNNTKQEQYPNTPVLPGPELACRARALQTQLLKYCSDNNVFQASRARAGQYSRENSGFTLLEVMIAMAIIAIALVAVFGSQSQSLSLANEAKFSTTAALLAQSKMAEIETLNPRIWFPALVILERIFRIITGTSM